MRIHVNELDDPVGVAAGRGSEELGGDLTGERDVFLEFFGLPGEHVRAIVHEALVLHQPGEPTAGMVFGIGHVNGAAAIRHGMRGVADVAVESLFGVAGRGVKEKPAIFVEIEILGLRFTRRPGVEVHPSVAAGLK